VFVLDCTRLGGISEMRVIDTLLIPSGHEDIFYVCNKINFVQSGEIDRVKGAAYDKLETRTALGKRRIFFLNAHGALEGRVSGDQSKVKESKILLLERALEQFLTRQRGPIKLARAAGEFANGLRHARTLIPQQIKLLRMDLLTFENRLSSIEAPLSDLERRRLSIVTHISGMLFEIKRDVIEMSEQEQARIIKAVPTWAEEHKLENSITWFNWTEAQVELAAVELSTVLNDKMQSSFARWWATVLQPQVRNTLIKSIADFKTETDVFIAAVEQLKIDTTFGAGIPRSDNPSVESASLSDRAISTVAGLLFLDPGLALTGAAFGYRGLIETALPQITIFGVASAALGSLLGLGFVPFAIVPAIAFSIMKGNSKIEQINADIKKEVAKEFCSQLKTNVRAHAKMVGEEVRPGVRLAGFV
jgi:hypothetical protein